MCSNPLSENNNHRTMIRQGIARCAVMLGVYLLCVGTILGILIFNFKTFETDYSDSVQGSWAAHQYFQNKQIHMYGEEDGFTVILDEDVVTVTYGDGKTVQGNFAWKNGYSGTLYLEDGYESFVSMDMNTRGDLKINLVRDGKTILLRRAEGSAS